MDAVMMEMSANIRAILVKQDEMYEKVAYLQTMKNRHEERISSVEKEIPESLDSRLRNIELNVKQNMFVISIVVALIVSVLTKLVSGFNV